MDVVRLQQDIYKTENSLAAINQPSKADTYLIITAQSAWQELSRSELKYVFHPPQALRPSREWSEPYTSTYRLHVIDS